MLAQRHLDDLLQVSACCICRHVAQTSSIVIAATDAVAAFNAKHRYRKRGLAAMPSKFGISFTTLFLNQAGALVHIYTGECSAARLPRVWLCGLLV